MELNSWSSPQMLRRYGASARSARARRTYEPHHGAQPMNLPSARLRVVAASRAPGYGFDAAARGGGQREYY